MAKVLKDQPYVRVVTLGTGMKPFSEMGANLDKSAYLLKRDEFMMNIDSFSADYYLMNTFKYVENDPEGYVRANTVSTFGLDSAKPEDLDGMERQGEAVFKEYEQGIMTIVKNIVDEKIGKKEPQFKKKKQENDQKKQEEEQKNQEDEQKKKTDEMMKATFGDVVINKNGVTKQ